MRKLYSLLNRRSTLILSGSIVFLFHLWAGLNYSYPYINNNSVNVIVEYLRSLYFTPGFAPWEHQINFYTGNPFFLLPLFLLLDLSPYTLRLALILCMAGASLFAFLSYVNIYNLKTGIIGVLILFNLNSWIPFRDGDYVYLVLFPVICLYLFTLWERKKNSIYLYLFGFFSGFFFYFKAIMAYFFIALVSAKLIETKGKFIRNLSRKEMAILLFSGILGGLPFLIYAVNRRFVFLPTALGIEKSHYLEEIGWLERLQIRITEFTHLVNPSKVLEIPDCTFCFDLNIIVLLLVTGLIISFLRRRNLTYTLAFILIFLSLLHIPNDIRWMQLMAIMPVVPIIILNIIPEFSDYREHLEWFIIIVLLVSMISTLATLDSYAENPSETAHWGGAQNAYNDYNNLSIDSNRVITNSYYIWVLSRYDLGTEETILLIPKKTDHIRDAWTNFAGKGRSTLNETSLSSDTLILVERPICQTEGDFCGYNKTEVIQHYNIENYTSTQTKIWKREPHIYRVEN